MDEPTFVFGIDGDQVYCHVLGFDVVPEDNFGFGNTKKEALEALLILLGPELT